MATDTFLLVHGAWHGAWCWEKVIPHLRKDGYEVRAIDLPGHGSDGTPVSNVTMDAYTSRVCEALDSCKGQVILVGHSMGGAVITQSGEYRPGKIKKLVYLTGFLLKNGQCLLDIANQDTGALVMRNAMLDERTNSLSFRRGAVKEIFYPDCSDDDAHYAESLLVPQAMAPFQTPMVTSEEKFGRIPRAYIECLNDRAITPGAQKRMYEALRCEKVISMNTGHSPFLSAPEELAKNLLSIV